MNVAAADRLDPAHLEKWWKITRAYLAGPLAESRSDDAVKETTRHPVPQVRGDRSVLALGMNAGIDRPAMLLREAVTEFSGYLDGIRANVEPFSTECLCQGTGVS